MTAGFHDLAWMTVSGTPGTGAATLAAAVAGARSFAAAGVADQEWLPLRWSDGSAWELSWGQYGASGPSITRNLIASSTGSLLSLTGAATVRIVPLAESFNDVRHLTSGSSWTIDSGIAPDGFLSLELASPAAFTITLPAAAAVTPGRTIGVKDTLGQAASYPITIAAPSGSVIENAGTFVLNQNFQAVTLKFMGSIGGTPTWSVI